MIKKLLCKIFGHKWVIPFDWNNLECERCGYGWTSKYRKIVGLNLRKRRCKK